MSAKQAGNAQRTLWPEEIVGLCFAKVSEYERYEDTKQQKAQFLRKLKEYREAVMSVINAANDADRDGKENADGRTDDGDGDR